MDAVDLIMVRGWEQGILEQGVAQNQRMLGRGNDALIRRYEGLVAGALRDHLTYIRSLDGPGPAKSNFEIHGIESLLLGARIMPAKGQTRLSRGRLIEQGMVHDALALATKEGVLLYHEKLISVVNSQIAYRWVRDLSAVEIGVMPAGRPGIRITVAMGGGDTMDVVLGLRGFFGGPGEAAMTAERDRFLAHLLQACPHATVAGVPQTPASPSPSTPAPTVHSPAGRTDTAAATPNSTPSPSPFTPPPKPKTLPDDVPQAGPPAASPFSPAPLPKPKTLPDDATDQGPPARSPFTTPPPPPRPTTAPEPVLPFQDRPAPARKQAAKGGKRSGKKKVFTGVGVLAAAAIVAGVIYTQTGGEAQVAAGVPAVGACLNGNPATGDDLSLVPCGGNQDWTVVGYVTGIPENEAATGTCEQTGESYEGFAWYDENGNRGKGGTINAPGPTTGAQGDGTLVCLQSP